VSIENGSRWAHFGSALRSRNYRLFFMGQGLSLIGTWMQRTALMWLIGTMFPSERIAAFWLGVVGFSGQIPSLVLTPLAGALADRWNRRRMVVVAQTLAMTQAFVLAALALTGKIELWHIVALSLWLGAVNAVDIPTRQAFLVEMVEGPDDLSNAIALNSSIVNVGRLAGPALGGILTALVGAGVCFLLNGLSFLAVIAALFAMRLKPRPPQPTHKHVLRDLADGFSYAFHFAPIRSLLLVMALVSLVGIPYSSLLPVFARHVLSTGAQGYGALMAGVGVGALVGAVYLAGRSTVRGLGRVIAFAPALMGTGLVVFAVSRSFALSLALTPFLGLGQILLMAACSTVLQTIVDDDKRGRVMAFYSLSFLGMMPLGQLLAGVASRQVGPSWTVAVGGVLCIAAAIVFSRRLPTLRALVRPIYVRKGIIPEVAAGLQSAAENTAVTQARSARDEGGAPAPR